MTLNKQGAKIDLIQFPLQLDFPELVASHWLIPLTLAVSGKGAS